MRYLVRPDGPRWYCTYLAPHGCVIRSELTKEQAIDCAGEMNRQIESGWSAGRESERIERRWGRARDNTREG